MTTTYDELKNQFFSKITEFDIISLDELNQNEIVDQIMINSLPEFKHCTKDLNDRDNDNRTFNIQLNEDEKDIISDIMSKNWLDRYILHQQKLQSTLGNKDYQLFSPANQLKNMLEIKLTMKKEIDSKINLYYYFSDGED